MRCSFAFRPDTTYSANYSLNKMNAQVKSGATKWRYDDVVLLLNFPKSLTLRRTRLRNSSVHRFLHTYYNLS